MNLNERQKQILNLLREQGAIRVQKLAKILHYSEMTIRRDLTAMEQAGLLKRNHGMAVENDINSQPITIRSFSQDAEKKVLCKKAATYLEDNINVFIDSSSTCIHLLPYIAEYKNITVFTNSVQVVLYAARFHIPCYLSGGEYYEHDMCLVGSDAENFARNINPDLAFFSCAGYNEDGKITDDDYKQTAVRKTVMKNAKKNIMLFDSSKKNMDYIFTVCEKDTVFDMITV